MTDKIATVRARELIEQVLQYEPLPSTAKWRLEEALTLLDHLQSEMDAAEKMAKALKYYADHENNTDHKMVYIRYSSPEGGHVADSGDTARQALVAYEASKKAGE